jgi:uracil-DNA glycosylase family 4
LSAGEALPSGRVDAFAALVASAHACRRCTRMEGRTRVLGPANGRLTAQALFVAEAPGRLGADVRGVPLAGDRTGRTFEALLAGAGLSRESFFFTNAVLCNPRDPAGRNDRPNREELTNCRDHLERLIEVLDPPWVVALGQVALAALGAIEPHGCRLSRDVGSPRRWRGRWLVPLYHPGPRALIHRPLAVQQEDYRRLAELVRQGAVR